MDNSEFLLSSANTVSPASEGGQWAQAHWARSPASMSSQSGLPLATQNGVPEVDLGDINRFEVLVKRVFDVLVSALALVALMPLFAIVAVAIKLTSRGPVLFRQYREGVDGAPFLIYKFRSLSVEVEDKTGVAQTRAGDPRVTKVGRFIRRTSIDELPQLLNVLFGDMSLVGPRPHVADMLAGGMKYTQLVPYYGLRLKMRPGLTGWAQANGLRGSTEDAAVAKARVDHDIAYIQNFSLALDLRILVKTVMREFLMGSGH